MERTYDYKGAEMQDIRDYMEDNREDWEGMSRDEVENWLSDVLWTEDSVTGNASGSYTFSRLQAKENFFLDDDAEYYLGQALEDFGITSCELGDWLNHGDWERLDVTIRCYLLSECISEVLDEVFAD